MSTLTEGQPAHGFLNCIQAFKPLDLAEWILSDGRNAVRGDQSRTS